MHLHCLMVFFLLFSYILTYELGEGKLYTVLKANKKIPNSEALKCFGLGG